MLKKASDKNRIFFIDELRGFSILCMIFYHAFYLFDSFFAWNWADTLFEFFMPVQPLFAGIFIFLCGISCTFSRNNLKRGLILLGIALGFTFVTAVIMPKMDFVGSEIYFGILHFLAVSILIYALFSRFFSRISPISGIILCAVFYPFTSSVADGVFSYGELVSFEIPESPTYESPFSDIILDALKSGPKTSGEIAEIARLPLPKINGHITLLELEGTIIRVPGTQMFMSGDDI